MRSRDYIFANPAAQALHGHRIAHGALCDTYSHLNRCAEEAFDKHLKNRTDPIATVRVWREQVTALHSLIDDMLPDTADKLWRAAKRREDDRPTKLALQWKCKVLRINPETVDPIALSGMTAIKVEGQFFLAVAYPAPQPAACDHSTQISDIILIHPETGVAQIHGDSSPALFRPSIDGDAIRFTVHADAITWAREFAAARIEWFLSKLHAKRIANITPKWFGLPPSALAIGPLAKIDWPLGIDVVTAGDGINPTELARAIKRRQPRVHTPMTMRGAA